MRTLLIAAALFIGTAGQADIPPQPSETNAKLQCEVVPSTKSGTPDSARTNQLIAKAEAAGSEVESISVSSAGRGKLLVCLTLEKDD